LEGLNDEEKGKTLSTPQMLDRMQS
jgi:hypothetical protein